MIEVNRFMDRDYKNHFNRVSIPIVMLIALVVLVPFVVGVLYSFTAWRGSFFFKDQTVYGSPFQAFVGVSNYVAAFHDIQFLKSLENTVRFMLICCVCSNAVALLIASLINSLSCGSRFFRVVFVIPALFGGLATGVIWKFIFEVLMSRVLFGMVGVSPVMKFTYVTHGAMDFVYAMAIAEMWQMSGCLMIVYVACLHKIPRNLYEAAYMDGADKLSIFQCVTLPHMLPAIGAGVFISLAWAVRAFEENIALIDGQNSMRLLTLQIIEEPSRVLAPDYGKLQAQSIVFFALSALITMVLLGIVRRRGVDSYDDM